MNNLLLDTDSYKASHFLQYPPGTEYMFSYIESRGGQYEKTVFFGLQYLLKEYLSKPITQDNVDEAEGFFKLHGLPFPKEQWEYIVNTHSGYLPIRIKAVPEGSIIPTKNILVSVESLDPKVFWVVGWLETLLLRIWYSVTVSTRSYHARQLIYKYLVKTSDNPKDEIWFKLHDFGSRGVSSRETAGIGGMSHLVNFKGSDTVQGILFANRYYNHEMAAFSIPASEHSVSSSYNKV
jgi:nicotinamide phosphoribosyltransferase